MKCLLSGASIPHFQALAITAIQILNNKCSYIALTVLEEKICHRKTTLFTLECCSIENLLF